MNSIELGAALKSGQRVYGTLRLLTLRSLRLSETFWTLEIAKEKTRQEPQRERTAFLYQDNSRRDDIEADEFVWVIGRVQRFGQPFVAIGVAHGLILRCVGRTLVRFDKRRVARARMP